MDDMAASTKEHFAIFQQAQHLRGSILVMTWGLLLATRDDSKCDYTGIGGDSLKKLKRIHSNAGNVWSDPHNIMVKPSYVLTWKRWVRNLI